jgi:ABC transporter substrate binding protein
MNIVSSNEVSDREAVCGSRRPQDERQPRGGILEFAKPFFVDRTKQLAALSLRHALPAIGQFREFAAAGGLMTYGGSITDNYRLVGVYTGRVLKGEKPADLPVQQATKVELILNLKTAKALALTIPPRFSRAPTRRSNRIRLLHRMSPELAVRPEGANHQWRRNPPGELSIDPVVVFSK